MGGVGMIAAVLMMLPGAQQAEIAIPGWMAGAWCTEGRASDRTCEYWTPDSGGLMIGATITTRGGKAVSFEQARIAVADGAPTYFAAPEGGPVVPFRAVAGEGMSISFAKPDHDYPQRIRYWREAEMLMAEISLSDGSRPMRWAYRRVG